MADEPRVARLHLVPTSADQAGDEVPVAGFDDLAGGGTDAGAATADLGLIGGGGGAGRPARLATVEQVGAPSGPSSAEQVSNAVDLGRISSTAPPPVRVARLGSTAAGRSSSGDRQRRQAGGGLGKPDLGTAETGRRRAGLGGTREASGSPASAVLSGDGEGSSRSGRAESGRAESGRAASGRAAAGRRERRPPGPKQIDPDADPVAAAKDICLDLLTARPRTKHELAEALRRRGVPDEAAATALDRFDEVGLIDDVAFAGQWVRSRQRTKGLARRALAMELRRKGVDDEVAGEALAEVDADAEELRARELVDRKLRTVPADTPEQRTSAARRLVGMLARKGYGGGIAYRVVREALAAHGADVDELGSEPVED